MKVSIQKLSAAGLLSGVLAVSFAGSAFAHVVVKPDEVVTAGFQTFDVSVPNEKDTSTVKIKLLIPDGLKSVTPTAKPGWQVSVEKDGSGENATVKSLTWSDGDIKVGFRDDFTFSAKVPEKAAELHWKAYQTYADGTVVSWDKPASADDHEGENSGPFSVTKVVPETAETTEVKKAEQAAADARDTADRAFYIGLAGVVVGLIAVFFATRRKPSGQR